MLRLATILRILCILSSNARLTTILISKTLKLTHWSEYPLINGWQCNLCDLSRKSSSIGWAALRSEVKKKPPARPSHHTIFRTPFPHFLLIPRRIIDMNRGSSNTNTYGANSEGNHWCTRGSSTAPGGAYHYSNTNGSYYYQNPNGSTYDNSGTGYSSYTPPSGNGSWKSSR